MKEPTRLHLSGPTATVVLVFLIQVASSFFFLDPAGFWTTDDDMKFLQVRQILQSKCADYSIPWRGAAVDPDFVYCPIFAPLGVRVEGRTYLSFSPFFATISAPFFKTWGYPGLYVLPLLGSLLALFAVSRIAGLVQDTSVFRSLAVALTGLCTPVWFYSLIFWEHLPALGLILWGLYFCFRFIRTDAVLDLFLCILFSVIAIYFREEMILACILMVILILRDKPGKRIAVATRAIIFATLCMTPLLILNFITIETPFGYHVSSNLCGLTSHLATRLSVFYNLLVAAHPDPILSLIMGIPLVVLLFWNPALPKRLCAWGFPALAVAALIYCGISFSGYWASPSPIQALMRSNSLFAASPLLLLGLARTGPTEQRHILSRLRALAVGYTLLCCLTAPEITSYGMNWGPRFLLLVYPLITLCALANVTQWWCPESPEDRPASGGKALVISVVAVCFFAQIHSIHFLQKRKAFSVRLNETLQSRDETIVLTDVWWVPQALHSCFFDREIFFTRSPEEARILMARLGNLHRTDFIFVTRAFNAEGMNPDVSIGDGGLNFFSLALFKCRADASRQPKHGGEK